MTQMSMMPRLAAAAAAALIGLIVLSASAFAQPANPHRFYGGGLTEGDTVGLGDASATADADGEWYIQASAEGVDEGSFTLNGKAATAELTERNETLTQVTLTVAMMEDDSMEDDSMTEDDGEMMEDDDSMMDDDDSMMEDDDSMMDDDEMLDEDDSMEEPTEFPETGSGGLADGGVSAGLIGLLIALAAASIAGLGYRRIRNRA